MSSEQDESTQKNLPLDATGWANNQPEKQNMRWQPSQLPWEVAVERDCYHTKPIHNVAIGLIYCAPVEMALYGRSTSPISQDRIFIMWMGKSGQAGFLVLLSDILPLSLRTQTQKVMCFCVTDLAHKLTAARNKCLCYPFSLSICNQASSVHIQVPDMIPNLELLWGISHFTASP